jgi:hypothetical protein
LRSLINEPEVPTNTFAQSTNSDSMEYTNNRENFERNLNQLKALHSQCLFNRRSPVVPGLLFKFDDSGALHGEFT